MKSKLLKLSLIVGISIICIGTNKAQIANPAPYCGSDFMFNYNMVKHIDLNGTVHNFVAGAFATQNTYLYYNNLTLPNLLTGSTAALSIGFYSPQDGEPRYFGVWIDYNQNNTFDPAELIMTNATTNNIDLPTFAQPNVTLTINFTIPVNTPAGITRMRIVRGGNPANFYGAYAPAFVPNTCNQANNFNYGCTLDFDLNITGATPPQMPVPQFMANITNTITNSTIQLTDQSTNMPNAWKWTITPATGYNYVNPSTSISQNPQVNFTTAGTYTVKLRATNITGSDSLTKPSYIIITNPIPQAPAVQFSANLTNALVNSVISLTDQSANFPTSWKWVVLPSSYSYVNGTSANSQNPKIKFNSAGSYTVALKVSNAVGSDSLTKPSYIVITKPMPVAAPVAFFFANITNTIVNTTISLFDQSTNSPDSWKWIIAPQNYSYQNGTTDTTQHPQVKFTSPGNYTVTLKVTNSLGNNSKTRTAYIIITPIDVSVNELAKNDNRVKVFPNPTSEYISLSMTEDQSIENIRLMDVSGKQVMTIKENANKIDLSGLPKGIYFLEINFDSTEKIVKEIIKE